jgi:hypothetical protein
MTWKAIGQSVTGSGHLSGDKICEDAICYTVLPSGENEVLICCVSDGAGSAQYAAWAADFATRRCMEVLTATAASGDMVTESSVYALMEDIYKELAAEADTKEVPVNEYSCTLLVAYIAHNRAVFFQVGDGAIVRNDNTGFYTPVWWPDNGEYQNTTSFIVDDPAFGKLNILILEEEINEVALFSDGLQMLALNMEHRNVHQPFFTDLFRFLRLADEPEKIAVLNRKLAEYLDSKQINERTNDDKTLFLASRLLA